MKTLSYFKLFLFFIACIIVVESCNKLDETSYSQIAPDKFFDTKSDVDAALVAMYKPLQGESSFEQAGTFVLNGASDEGTSDNPIWGQYDILTYTAGSSPEVSSMWTTFYSSINSANFVLDNQNKIEALDATTGKTYTMEKLAEARFMRGMDYFFLVQLFGDVPLRTTSTTRQDQTDIPRSPVDSVYAQIIQDFQFAFQNLPEVPDLAGKPTKYAAESFLAKVYLTKGDYANALSSAEDVSTHGPYSLLPSFADIFNPDDKNNSEVIFAIQYIRQDLEGMRMPTLVLGPDDHFAYGGKGGWGLMNIEDKVYPSFSPNDGRLATTFADPTPGQTTYYAGKWRDIKGVSVDGHGNNYIVYRYADLLLILAEASNNVNGGPGAEAYDAINLVRKRAQLPDVTPGLSKNEFQDTVAFERFHELCFEEWRWFDLKRTGKLKATLTADEKVWNDKYYLFPIPQSEIDASAGKIKQNPGY